jgi:hypothetical protein
VTRIVKRIHAGPPQMGSILLKQASQREDLRSHMFVQLVELRLKLIADFNAPFSL